MLPRYLSCSKTASLSLAAASVRTLSAVAASASLPSLRLYLIFRESITPGTVLIILAGRFIGKRVVFSETASLWFASCYCDVPLVPLSTEASIEFRIPWLVHNFPELECWDRLRKHKRIVLEALILTSGVFFSLTGYTFWASKKGKDFSYLRPILFASLMVLFLTGLIQHSKCLPLISPWSFDGRTTIPWFSGPNKNGVWNGADNYEEQSTGG